MPFYFVTICAQNRKCLFGRYLDGEFTLNDAGKMVENVWSDIPVYYPGFNVREFVVMPNHVHGIVEIIQFDDGRARDEDGRARGPAPTESGSVMTLFDIVQRFKSMTTNKYAHGVKHSGWPSYDKRMWQRGYWEHVIRNECELRRIAEYIRENPHNYRNDKLRHTPFAS